MDSSTEELYSSCDDMLSGIFINGKPTETQLRVFLEAMELPEHECMVALARYEHVGSSARYKKIQNKDRDYDYCAKELLLDGLDKDFFFSYLSKTASKKQTPENTIKVLQCKLLLVSIKQNKQLLLSTQYIPKLWDVIQESSDPDSVKPSVPAVVLRMSESPGFKQYVEGTASSGCKEQLPSARSLNSAMMVVHYYPRLKDNFCYKPQTYLPLFQQTNYYLKGHGAAHAIYSPDSTHVMLLGDKPLKPNGSVPRYIINLQTGQSTYLIKTSHTSVEFHPTNHDLVTTKYKSKLSVINFRTGQTLYTHRVRKCPSSFKYSPGGNFMALEVVPPLTKEFGGVTNIQVYSLSENHQSQKLMTEFKNIIRTENSYIAFSSDEQLLMTSSPIHKVFQIFKQSAKGKWLAFSQIDLRSLSNGFQLYFRDSSTVSVVTKDYRLFHYQISEGKMEAPVEPVLDLSQKHHELMFQPLLNKQNLEAMLPYGAAPLNFLGKEFLLFSRRGQINIHYDETGEYICHIEMKKNETAYSVYSSPNKRFLLVSYYNECGPILISLPSREELLDRLARNRGVLKQAHEYNASISELLDEHLVQNTNPEPSAPPLENDDPRPRSPKPPSPVDLSKSAMQHGSSPSEHHETPPPPYSAQNAPPAYSLHANPSLGRGASQAPNLPPNRPGYHPGFYQPPPVNHGQSTTHQYTAPNQEGTHYTTNGMN